MQKNLWNLDIDYYVAKLADTPTFSDSYQVYLKNVYKNIVNDMQNKMELDCENLELVFEFIIAEQLLNLILFCFSYD